MARDAVARLVAEQLAIDCATTDVEALLGDAGAAGRRLLAVLRLAGDSGEAAGLHLLGDSAPPARERSHELTTDAVARHGDRLCVEFEWRTQAYAVLFDVLRGRLDARPGPLGAVVAVEGMYAVPGHLCRRPLGVAAARRAAEAAVRTLLGQLRAALEHPTLAAPR